MIEKRTQPTGGPKSVRSRGECSGESKDPQLEAALDPGAPYYGEHDENGVDLSLLRYLLKLSPNERLILMERHARDTRILYDYGRRHREAAASSGR